MKRSLGFVASVGVVLTFTIAASATMRVFTAYHDFNNTDGLSVTPTEEPDEVPTTSVSGQGSTVTPITTTLLNALDAQETGVVLSIVAKDSGGSSVELVASPNGAHPTEGDALAIFGDISSPLSATGNVGGGAELVQTLILTFSNLRIGPDQRYDVTLYSDLNLSGSREVLYTISDADSFENTSSSGISGASALIDVLENAGVGDVARFSNILPGLDGDFTITLTHNGNGPIVNAMYVTAVPEPATMALLAVGGVVIAFRRRRIRG